MVDDIPHGGFPFLFFFPFLTLLLSHTHELASFDSSTTMNLLTPLISNHPTHPPLRLPYLESGGSLNRNLCFSIIQSSISHLLGWFSNRL